MKSKALILTAVVASALLGCGDHKDGAQNIVQEVGVITVKTEPVTISREFTGRVVSKEEAEIRPQITGIVKARLFNEGDHVEKDQVLYQIDDASYKAAYDEAMAKLEALRPEVSAAEWGFRFLQTIPEVKLILSGMSTLGQLERNCAMFSDEKPLNEEEWNALQQIAREMIEKEEVPCTACHYCVEHCPKGLDIPKLIALYNEQHFTGGGFIAPMRLSTMGEGHLPCDCIACHSCEKVCPQNIKISEVMKKFTDELLQNDRFQVAKETV